MTLYNNAATHWVVEYGVGLRIIILRHVNIVIFCRRHYLDIFFLFDIAEPLLSHVTKRIPFSFLAIVDAL